MALYSLQGHSPQLPGEGDYFIAPGAHLIGKVVLERKASVWFCAVLRGDNEQILIGENCNVQDAAVLHTDMGYPLTLARNVTIGHQAMLHGCQVGENTLIGIGAVILNGAVIGKNCIIGARALITEGKQIPDNSLVVGSPGRVVRTLKEPDVEFLKTLADHYVQNLERYNAGFTELK